MRKRTLFPVVVFLIVSLFSVTTGCSKGFQGSESNSNSSSSNSNTDLLDPGFTNQKPSIGCRISNMENSSLNVMSINTLSSRDQFFDGYPVEGQRLMFDCTGTEDETPTSNLVFSIDTDYDRENPDFTPFEVNDWIQLDRSGFLPMALKVTDPQGLSTVKTFNIFSQCEDGVTPTIDASKVYVSQSSKHNFYNYWAEGAVNGGRDFSYSWDFNGDGVFDPVSLESLELWTNSPVLPNIYSIFASAGLWTHYASLRVRNGCNFESQTIQVALPQELPNIDRTPESEAVPKGYYYLQADISGTPPNNQRVNGPYLATQYPGDEPKRVICSYNHFSEEQKSTFGIQGLNWYRPGPTFSHGMNLVVSNIPDTGQLGATTSDESDGVVLSSPSYSVSEAGDGIPFEMYNQPNPACKIEITVERALGPVPCEGQGPGGQAIPVATIYGEFSCPSLSALNGDWVAVQNGKFYCQVSLSDQCPGGGGGGGGGGGNPPIPQ